MLGGISTISNTDLLKERLSELANSGTNGVYASIPDKLKTVLEKEGNKKEPYYEITDIKRSGKLLKITIYIRVMFTSDISKDFLDAGLQAIDHQKPHNTYELMF